MLKWMPEYKQELEGPKNAITVAGMDEMIVSKDYGGKLQRQHTVQGAQKEMAYYIDFLQSLSAPTFNNIHDNMGTLFDTENDFFLGI